MGTQFWWFYDVLAVAAVLICVFITAKKGLLKAGAALVGYILSFAIAMSVSAPVANTIYNSAISKSNTDKLRDSILSDGFLASLGDYIETEYEVIVDLQKIKNIYEGDKDFDSEMYKYLNNINSKTVTTEDEFYKTLHNGYAEVMSDLISDKLSLYAGESAAEQIRKKPQEMDEVIPLFIFDEEAKARPAAEKIEKTYVAEPYKKMVRLVCFVIILIVLLLISIFIATAFGGRYENEGSIGQTILSGAIGVFKGAVVVFAIAAVVRLYVILGSDKMLFFNHTAIDKTFIFKYVYNIIQDM